MIGSFLTRALGLALGYAYPAYECFKTVELNRPEMEQLRFWCQYWILVAALTVFERVADTFISWMPMYSEAKVVFFLYLWYPKTRGTTYIYETFFRPYVASHETEIDRNLLELKIRAGDMIFLYCQKAAVYGQTRVFEIFQYIASQAPQQQTRSRSTLQRQPAPSSHQASAPTSAIAIRAAAAQKPTQALRAPPSPTKSKNVEPPNAHGDPLPVPATQIPPSLGVPTQPSASVSSSPKSTGEGEAKQNVNTDESNVQALETPMEEAIRMTRGRLRKRATTFGLPTR
ncbi:HVA22-like protein i [Platanthera zijinensis]|uniref:HVA22-like protein n=1 Tax=Platanthera zijinensis TaxID=2320716 RepID=A0AAP0C233_9ASPA